MQTAATSMLRLLKELKRKHQLRHIMDWSKFSEWHLIWRIGQTIPEYNRRHTFYKWLAFSLVIWTIPWHFRSAGGKHRTCTTHLMLLCHAHVPNKLKRCNFLCININHLGHVIHPEQMVVLKHTIDVIWNWKPLRISRDCSGFWASARNSDALRLISGDFWHLQTGESGKVN